MPRTAKARSTTRKRPRSQSLARRKGTDLITHMPEEMIRFGRGGWVGLLNAGAYWRVHEPFAGAWQRNISSGSPEILAHSTVWACVTRIMTDVGKLAVNLIQQDANGIWIPTDSPAFSPVLRKPNHYQNRIKFFESWIASKLLRGNTYILKARDNRGVVVKLFILEPSRVTPLVAPTGDVFYDLEADNLAGIEGHVQVPASEIIHDLGPTPYHPLCGLSPLMAAALPALQSLKIQESQAKFFANNSKPGGVLTAPSQISNETADRIQRHWEANYAGEDNIGKVVVLGDGLHYEQMAVSANDAQLIDQLNWGDDRICSVFAVPAFMVGVGKPPGDQSVEHLIGLYYALCIQGHLESIELSLDQGLALPAYLGIEFDVEGLIRMDAATKMKIATDGVKGGVFSPNEARNRYFSLTPVKGGESPMMQQQQWSLEDLAERRNMGIVPKPPTPIDQPDDGVTEADDAEKTFKSVSWESWEEEAYQEAQSELADVA